MAITYHKSYCYVNCPPEQSLGLTVAGKLYSSASSKGLYPWKRTMKHSKVISPVDCQVIKCFLRLKGKQILSLSSFFSSFKSEFEGTRSNNLIVIYDIYYAIILYCSKTLN